MEQTDLSCVDCRTQGCARGTGEYPGFCPTARIGSEGAQASVEAYGEREFDAQVMAAASEVSTEAFQRRWCRVEETLAFFSRMGWERIGIASCSGLQEEAAIFAQILRVKGFAPYGVACKVGAVPKAAFDAPESCCDFGTVSCNPILQAQLLAQEGTQANVVMGLCVGHDMLFNEHSQAPVTTLVTKDRALFHNPVGALYGARTSTFYNSLLKPDDPK